MAARAMWTGAITCGLVSVPCKLVTARTPRTVRFNQINSETGNRVRQKRVDEGSGVEVKYENIVKGFEISPDRYVVLSDEELETVEPRKTKQVQISQFCRREDVPDVAITNAYWVAPNTGGGHGYRLLADTMRELDVVGIGRVVLRTVEYLVCLSVMDDGVMALETLAWADEINSREDLGNDSPGEISDMERKMAAQLVSAMTTDFDHSVLHDQHREKVMSLIESKAAGLEPVIEETPEPEPAVDMLAALEASLTAVRGDEEKTTKRRSTKRTTA